jgi:UDP-3-O-[3-hydroxymyristoyl] glucosamine N-acyltransferase
MTDSIHPKAYVFPDCVIGENCRIGPYAVVGSLGVWANREEDGSLTRREAKGKVVIKDEVDIGTLTCIHRGFDSDTVIGEGTFIGPQCNIGHDVKIGKNCIILNQSLLSGYVEVGDNARINIKSVVTQKIKIGSNAVVGMGSLVLNDVPPDTTVVGRPAIPIDEFRYQRKRLKEIFKNE